MRSAGRSNFDQGLHNLITLIRKLTNFKLYNVHLLTSVDVVPLMKTAGVDENSGHCIYSTIDIDIGTKHRLEAFKRPLMFYIF